MRNLCTNLYTRLIATHSQVTTRDLTRKGLAFNGVAVVGVLTNAVLFPNPFCLIFNTISPWAFGAIMIGLVAAVIGFAMMFLNPNMSSKLTSGLIMLGVAMLLLGVVSTDTGLDGVAGIFGVPTGKWCART